MENTYEEYSGKMPKVAGLKILDIDHNWVTGTYKEYKFQAKVFAVKSEFGINQGRVSKLCVIKDTPNIDRWDHEIFNYDRGMDVDHPIGHEIAALFDQS